MRIHRLGTAVAVAMTAGLIVAAPSVTTSYATQPSEPVPNNGAMPNAVPSTKTPPVNNGAVRAIARVGNKIVMGGTFTSVSGLVRNSVAAFDKTTGVLDAGFAPSVDGPVWSVIPGPVANTAYIAGAFTTVGGVTRKNIALVNVNTGAVDPTFQAPGFPAKINDLVLRGNRLYVAGAFTKVGLIPHAGLASLDPITGDLTPFMNVQLTGHHNDTGSGAQGPVGPWNIDVTADGNRMVAIGNFKRADGLLRDQVVQIDLTGASAVVKPDWATSRYAPYCIKSAFDSYVRGVSFSPDGSYFVVAATGGPSGGTLCDAAARFETNATGTDVQPTWVDETGGDTLWAVTITDTAVFVGGHQRWANNPTGTDNARPGAVPRPGLMALDPISGRPMQWNPGRNPPGTAVYALLGTVDGVYVGSNTDWIGNRQYKRPKIAFFPYAGGLNAASTRVGQLPGSVYLAGNLPAPAGTDGLERIGFDGTTAAPPQVLPTGGITWNQTRGAFMVGNKLFYGWTDGFMHSRTYDGTTFGPDVKIDPYHDPVWANVDNNLGGTFNGSSPTLYGQLSTVTGMFYADGRLYYTLSGDSRLRWRWFSPDSGIVDERSTIVSSSINFSSANGMFINGSTLYYASTDGNLRKVAFVNGAVTGSSTTISTGINWRNRGMFLFVPRINVTPAALFTSTCTFGHCSFDGTESFDPDGSIASYSWDFGDGGSASIASPSHVYTQAGQYNATLTVTDNDSAPGSVTHQVTVNVPQATNMSFVGAAHSTDASAKVKQVTVPAGAQAGDTMMLVLTRATTASWTGPTGLTGWTQVDSFANSTVTSTLWTRTIAAGEPGSSVSFTSPAFAKAVLNLGVYRGVESSATVTAAHAGDLSTAVHTTPTVNTDADDWVISIWADKSETTTGWTSPAGMTLRDSSVGASAGRYGSLWADTGGGTPGGPFNGVTATTNAPSSRGMMFSVVLTPTP